MKIEVVRRTVDGVPYLTTPDFEEHKSLAAGFSTRFGGVSEGAYSTLNFSISSGDNPVQVRENYSLFTHALGADKTRIAAVRQVHSCTVLQAPEEAMANPFSSAPFVSADAVVTDAVGVFPVCYYADCVPLLLYDPGSGVCGAVHAGWRGAQKRVLAAALEKMVALGADLQRTLLAIGPSICPRCFEVGDEVAELFVQAFPGHPEVIVHGYDKPHVDLWHAVEVTAVEAGMPSKNITCLGICNYEQPHTFFSHRRHKEERGTHMALVGVREICGDQ